MDQAYKPNILDKIIRFFDPRNAVVREQARMALNVIDKSRRFDGASRGHRFSQWKRPGSSADAALVANLTLLRNGSRDLTRNNPWAEKALNVIENNTVGTGIIGQINHKNPRMKEEIQKKWADWTSTTDIDADGKLDLIGIQSLVIRTIVESGEVLIRRRYRRASDNLAIPVQLQVLEPDYLDQTRDGLLSNGKEIKNGIEFDKRGKRIAYWLYTQHPGDTSVYTTRYESVRVPASEIIHAYHPKRAGQTRGYPWIASAIRRLKDFDDYEDAQLVRQKIASCFTAFIHDMNQAQQGATGLDSTGKPKDDQLEFLTPGVIERLPAGKQISFPNPPAVQNYREYVTTLLLGVAAAYGITYEALTGDYSNVNFSSARMAWIEMSKNVDKWQRMILKVQVLKRIERWFFAGLSLQGIDNSEATMKWMYPRKEMIDPTKEIPAAIKGIRAGITSLPRTHASMGMDTDEIMEEIEESNKKLDDKGIVLDSDPRKVNTSGSSNDGFSKETDEN